MVERISHLAGAIGIHLAQHCFHLWLFHMHSQHIERRHQFTCVNRTCETPHPLACQPKKKRQKKGMESLVPTTRYWSAHGLWRKAARWIPDPSASMSSKHSLRSCRCCFVNSGRTNLPWARNQPAIDSFCNTACVTQCKHTTSTTTTTQPIFPASLFVNQFQPKSIVWSWMEQACGIG